MDFDVCRVCLDANDPNDANISIYDEVQEFNMTISDLLIFYGEMTINDKDIYPKMICDGCLRELLIVAKFKEKVKHSESTLSQLIVSDDKISNNDEVIEETEETEETQADGFSMIKEECDAGEITGSYEEVEFLEVHGQTDTMNGIQFVTIDKCDDDDEFIDEIIEECSVEDSDIIETNVSDIVDTTNPIIFKKSPPKQTTQHLTPNDSKVIINFNCAYCGAGFMHSNNLKKHMSTHRSEIENIGDLDESNDLAKTDEMAEIPVKSGRGAKKNVARPHKCENCDRAFVSKSLLLSHIRTHTGERPFACNQCQKNFATQGGLDLHTRRHLGLKNYVCNICERRFVESSNLKVHLRTHTGERPHRCNRCSRSFSRVFLLQIHQRTHTGERPHQCPTCFKGFAQQGDLAAHRRIHTGERPHQCTICLKGFIKSSALTSHMKRHNDKVLYDSSEKKTTPTTPVK